jgi:hypothetical protein
MTVAELIEWLKTQDQGATVEVLVGKRGRSYEGDRYYFSEFRPVLSNYTDFRGNPHVKPNSPYFNSRILELGEEE